MCQSDPVPFPGNTLPSPPEKRGDLEKRLRLEDLGPILVVLGAMVITI